MFALMADNPVYDTKACTNSASSLDDGLSQIFHAGERFDDDEVLCRFFCLLFPVLLYMPVTN